MGTYGDAVTMAALGSSDPPCHPGNLSVVRTGTHTKVFSADPLQGAPMGLVEPKLLLRSCAVVATDSTVNEVSADCSAPLAKGLGGDLLDYQWTSQSLPRRQNHGYISSLIP